MFQVHATFTVRMVINRTIAALEDADAGAIGGAGHDADVASDGFVRHPTYGLANDLEMLNGREQLLKHSVILSK